MPGKSFKTLRRIDQIMNLFLILIDFFEFRVHLQRFVNRDIQLLRNHFCNGIHLCIWKIHNTTDITDNTTGRQCTKCNDLYDTVIPVFTSYIIDNFLSSFKTEVNVDIRHGYSFRIQETLKQKIISNRIKLCDPQSIGNQTSCSGASSRSYHNVMVARIFNKVPYNQEVIDIAHIPDRGQFII